MEWSVQQSPVKGYLEVRDKAGHTLAQLIPDLAVARVMATAPELLDVCKAISFDVGSFEFTDGEYRLSEQSAGVILQALREVIAKAERRGE